MTTETPTAGPYGLREPRLPPADLAPWNRPDVPVHPPDLLPRRWQDQPSDNEWRPGDGWETEQLPWLRSTR